MVLFVPAFLAMAAPLWERRPRVAAVGLTMSVTGLFALVSLMGSGPVSLAMSGATDRAVMVEATDRYESSWLVLVWVLLMVVGYSLGPVVLGFGLWRSGFPVAVPPAARRRRGARGRRRGAVAARGRVRPHAGRHVAGRRAGVAAHAGP